MSQIKINRAILQFPNLFEPKSYQDGKATYNTKILLSKTEHKDTIDSIKLVLKNMCLDNKILVKPDSFKCFKDGTESGYDSQNDYYILTAKANVGHAPKVLNRDLTPFAGTVSSGDIVNLVVTFWSYNNAVSKGIACNLKAVQITGESNSSFVHADDFVAEEAFENLGSKISKDSDFDSLDDEIPF